jgi:putative endonuclease
VRRDTTTRLGRKAENQALAYLCAQGLTLLERNYRCRGGEIDLVMRQGTTLILVEVRLRSEDQYGGAAGSVGSRKQRRIIRAAHHLLMMRPELGRMRARFDVIAIDGDGANRRLNWIRDAFNVA